MQRGLFLCPPSSPLLWFLIHCWGWSTNLCVWIEVESISAFKIYPIENWKLLRKWQAWTVTKICLWTQAKHGFLIKAPRFFFSLPIVPFGCQLDMSGLSWKSGLRFWGQLKVREQCEQVFPKFKQRRLKRWESELPASKNSLYAKMKEL